MKTSKQAFFLGVLNFLIIGYLIVQSLCNFILSSKIAIQNFPDSFQNSQPYPGVEFLPLQNYLQGQTKVGYYTDRISSSPFTDVQIMRPYQQAQYALSPVLLDYGNLEHNFIILNCQHKGCLSKIAHQFQGKICIDLKNGISLIKRLGR